MWHLSKPQMFVPQQPVVRIDKSISQKTIKFLIFFFFHIVELWKSKKMKVIIRSKQTH